MQAKAQPHMMDMWLAYCINLNPTAANEYLILTLYKIYTTTWRATEREMGRKKRKVRMRQWLFYIPALQTFEYVIHAKKNNEEKVLKYAW